jgi:hypothetical protein
MIAIDYETFYHKKTGVSVAEQGAYHYVRDPAYSVLLAAVYGEGIEFCGHPEDFDWTLLHGKDLCAHNVGFDKMVFDRMKELGQIPAEVEPRSWSDTADLAAWEGSGRSLTDAAAALLGHRHSKQMRTSMSGVDWNGIRAKGWEKDFIKYGLTDAVLCHRLWETFNRRWPENEQRLSRINREMGEKGVRVDLPLLESGLGKLHTARWNAEQQIPWDWSDNKTPLSSKKLAAECRKEGIPVPETTNKKEDACIAWLEEYGRKYPWVRALHQWRSANALIARLEKIRDRIRPDGTMQVDLLYFGAHTGRFSGVGGVNFGNMSREEIHGVRVRELFVPRPGYVFHIADLAQIEPRVLAVLSGDGDFLKECRRSSPYQAHALRFMGWQGENLKKEDPTLYALAKARVLALGYGAGWQRFLEMVPTYIPDPAVRDQIFLAPVSRDTEQEFFGYLERQRSDRAKEQTAMYQAGTDDDRLRMLNAWRQVISFRESNPLITGLWRTFEDGLKTAAQDDGVMEVPFPSGRTKRYTDVTSLAGEIRCRVLLGGPMMPMYGGKVTENVTQAVARDVFVEGYLDAADKGWHIPFHVYDEYVLEVPEGTPVQETEELLCRTVPWMPDLPIAVEVAESYHYTK